MFLLTGIALLLGVIGNRLGAGHPTRARMLERDWPALDEHARQSARSELVCLERRRRLASWSINFCTAAALLVCLVIVALFIGEFFGRNLRVPAGALFVLSMVGVIVRRRRKFFGRNLRVPAGALFVLSMVGVIGGLASFLREVYIATHSTSIDPARFELPPRT